MTSRTSSDHGRDVGIIVCAPKGATLRGIVAIRTLSVSFFLNTFWELLDSTLCVIQITRSIKSVI